MQKIEEPIGEPTVVTVGKDITPGLQSLDSNSKLSVTKFLNHKNSKQKKANLSKCMYRYLCKIIGTPSQC